MANRTNRTDRPAKYRAALLAERARLLGGRTDKEILVLPGCTAIEDQAPLIHDQFVALRHHRMELRKLKLIDAALGRLKNREFGICSECDEPIAAKRLEVVPWAAYCVACQDAVDERDDTDRRELREMIA